jgi:uncharacterized membrane protein
MKINKYRVYRMLIGGGLAITVGLAIATNIPLIALAGVAVAIALAFIMERSNKEVVSDERVLQIRWKSGSAAFTIMMILAAVASLGIALFNKQLPENVVFFGSIMGYYVCAAVLLQLGFYTYFSRKL